MKTRVIVHRSLIRGTLMTLAALTLIACLLPARAEAGVRVVAQVGPVAVDYRDRGPGYDAQAQARILLDPVAARVYVGRQCGTDYPDCLVRVMERCGRHDRDRDGRCDKCERRDRRGRGRDRDDDCDRDHRHAASGRTYRDGRCEHSDRCDACGFIEIGGCRDHRGLVWVAGHYEARGGRPGRGNQVWLAGHWERLEVAYR